MRSTSTYSRSQLSGTFIGTVPDVVPQGGVVGTRAWRASRGTIPAGYLRRSPPDATDSGGRRRRDALVAQLTRNVVVEIRYTPPAWVRALTVTFPLGVASVTASVEVARPSAFV